MTETNRNAFRCNTMTSVTVAFSTNENRISVIAPCHSNCVIISCHFYFYSY